MARKQRCALWLLLEGNTPSTEAENRLVLQVRGVALGERGKERSGTKQSNRIQLQLN